MHTDFHARVRVLCATLLLALALAGPIAPPAQVDSCPPTTGCDGSG